MVSENELQRTELNAAVEQGKVEANKTSSLDELVALNKKENSDPVKGPKKNEPNRVHVESVPIRVKFGKTGKMKYISHLDLCRTMKSSMKRAGIPVWYTEGFNPHPKMVFSLPLSLFSESVCEFMDIKITENMPHDEVRDRMNRVFSEDMRVYEVYTPTTKFSDIGYSEYEIEIFDIKNGKSWFEKLLSGPIEVVKHTKSGEKLTDIKPFIKSCEVTEEADKLKLKAVLCAASAEFLNPEYLIKAVGDLSGQTLNEYSILRTEVFNHNGESFR